MKTLIKNDSIYSLNNLDNYNVLLENNIDDIIYKYTSIIVNYLKHLKDNLVSKSYELDLFIVIRGLDTLTHVFQLLLVHTNNVEITSYHTEKSYYYYVEFVTQISTDDKNFLQLSSRDATNYVYKKTIHDIKSDEQKINYSNDTLNKIFHIQNLLDLNKLLFTIYITKKFFMDKDNKELHEIKELQNKILNMNLNKDNFKIFSKIVDFMYDHLTSFNHFISLLKQIAKKICINHSILEKISKNIEILNKETNHGINIFLNREIIDILKDITKN